MEDVDYTDTFIAVAPDTTATTGVVPQPRGGAATVASATFGLLSGKPYHLRSSDVIFEVWATRQGLSEHARGSARAEYFAKPRACLRASDLGKRYGWGIHADQDGRIALYAVDSPEYEALAAGRAPDDRPVKVTAAMRSGR